MSLDVGIWRIDQGLTRLTASPLAKESLLEDALVADPTMLGLDILLIGRQVITDDGKRIDLLGIDADGALYVIELKRDKTPRDAVAQLLDYGFWVQGLSHDAITDLFARFAPHQPFEEAFEQRFGGPPPEALNTRHQLLLVAAELDPSSERIVQYAAGWGVPLNVVFFRHFRDGDRQYLARTWLREATTPEVPPKAVAAKEEPWNGLDFGVTLGDGEHRRWEDCRRYGFVAGGQGAWYSRTLKQLFRGARVFVAIPGKGYVGVGTVTEPAVPVQDFLVDVEGEQRPLLSLPLTALKMSEHADDPERSEWLVRVAWTKTVPASEGFWKPGMRANQNTAFKLRNKFTIDQLVEHFQLDQ